jgi:hypothetical protein
MKVDPERAVVRDRNPIVMTLSAPADYLGLAVRVYQNMVYPTDS